MYYYCPKCTSMKMPRTLNYFPPKTVECLNCGYIDSEIKFIKQHQQKSATLHYIH
jgi:uncharacterized Zn finger protein